MELSQISIFSTILLAVAVNSCTLGKQLHHTRILQEIKFTQLHRLKGSLTFDSVGVALSSNYYNSFTTKLLPIDLTNKCRRPFDCWYYYLKTATNSLCQLRCILIQSKEFKSNKVFTLWSVICFQGKCLCVVTINTFDTTLRQDLIYYIPRPISCWVNQ